jgi:hypothetical protein
MMDQLEPEEKERMKKQMAMQSDPTQMIGQLWGELTNANADEARPPSPAKKSQHATKK